MLRETLIALCLTAAPVPPPPELTDELLCTTWAYSWGQWATGIIAFSPDGSYSAQHQPGGTTAYCGTWTRQGNVVTIRECSFCAATGARQGGPTTYVLDFGKSAYPALKGLSNGTTAVELTRPVKP